MEPSAKQPPEAKPTPFISLFAGRAGVIAQRFYSCYRAHQPASTEELVSLVRQDAWDRRHSPWATEAERQENLDLIHALTSDRDEALAFAAQVIARENLPPEERQRLKEERAAAGRRAWVDRDPPTDAQLRYLKALGYEGEVRGKGHASELIDQLASAAGGGGGGTT